jgi:hypothetical protein
METLRLRRLPEPRRVDRLGDAYTRRADVYIPLHRSRCRAATRTCCAAAYSTPPEESGGVLFFK